MIEYFGEILTEARVSAGLSRAELAERTGMADSTLAKLERGESKPRLDTVYRLAEALGISEWALVLPTNQHAACKYAGKLALELLF